MSGARRGKSRVRGASALRRTLKALPEDVRAELVQTLETTGRAISILQQRNAPPSRRVRENLGYKLFPRTLRVIAGYVTKRDEQRAFIARFYERGIRAQTVRVKRELKGGIGISARLKRGINRSVAGVVSVYTLRVRARPAQPFVFSSGGTGYVRAARTSIGEAVRRALQRGAARVQSDT